VQWVRFLWAEGVSEIEIRRRLSVQCGYVALPQRNMYEWITMSKTGRTSVTDEERRGCPSISTSEGSDDGVCPMLLDTLR
jgi:hypothetical protein